MKREVVMQGEELLQLIPQRAPIVMVDTFYGLSDADSYTGLAVLADNIFVANDHLLESGLIEHLAQSAAVRAGYQFHIENKEVPLGFIASVDKLTVHRLPAVGETLFTTIRTIQQVGNITLIHAESSSNNERLIEGRMKIFLDIE